MTTANNDEALYRNNNKLLLEYLPIMVFMTIMGAIGVAGNIVTPFFYRGYQHTSTTVLIVGLAVVDLIVCCLSFTTVADMVFIVMNVQLDRYLCKMMLCSFHWMICSSAIILWVISIDRYLKLCRPQWEQFSVRTANIAIVISIVVALLESVRKLFTYDTVVVSFTANGDISHNRTNASFVRYICTSTDEVELRSLVHGFNVFEAIAGSVILLTFVFSYGSIARTLLGHTKTMVSVNINMRAGSIGRNTEQSVDSQTQVTDCLRSQDAKDAISNGVTVDGKPITANSTSHNNDESCTVCTETGSSQKKAHSHTAFKKAVNKPRKSSNRLNPTKQSERNVTFMMLAVTVGFFICFVPYFVVIVGIPSTIPGKQKLDTPIQFAVRSPFWNSVINPILFCVINPRYRQYVKNILKRR